MARLAAVDPEAYARSRNALDGAVTRLSPYLTHGLLGLSEAYHGVSERHPLDAGHKFTFELGWRAYYRHAWAHLGDGIQQSLHPGVLPDAAYLREMPADVLEARTGIPVIDLAVCELYASGYLHNHARMWLASYLVHLRKVHWRAGAQWMLGHLLDGDLASNHLSWQWVAGTGSTKPYLFNADNVAKYAPAQWHSPGSVLDASYEALGQIAASEHPCGDTTGIATGGVEPPSLHGRPPVPPWLALGGSHRRTGASEPVSTAGCDVWLLHPWSLGGSGLQANERVLCIGVGFASSHGAMPWSEKRWRFVTDGLLAHTPHLWWGEADRIAQALAQARTVHWQAEPHADGSLQTLHSLLAAMPDGPTALVHTQPDLFEPVESYCPSFAKWWRQTGVRKPYHGMSSPR